jgi:branched-chain amino acid transport system permease protein
MTGRQNLLYFLSLHRTGLTVTLMSAALLVFPFVEDNPYTLGLTNLIAINAIVVLGLNLFIGYAGQISLGHAAFFGMGAYGSAVATVTFGLPPWPAMALVAVLVGLVAMLIGIPILRLSGHYLAMATLGLNYVVHTVLLQWDEVTGGPSGFAGIPNLTVPGAVIDDPVSLHFLLWTFAMVCMLFCLNLVRRPATRPRPCAWAWTRARPRSRSSCSRRSWHPWPGASSPTATPTSAPTPSASSPPRTSSSWSWSAAWAPSGDRCSARPS